VRIPAGDISVHVAKSFAADDKKTVPGLLFGFEFPVPTAYPLPLLSIFTPAHHINLKRNVITAFTLSEIEIIGSPHVNATPKICRKGRVRSIAVELRTGERS
jgi:hypothetical protein